MFSFKCCDLVPPAGVFVDFDFCSKISIYSVVLERFSTKQRTRGLIFFKGSPQKRHYYTVAAVFFQREVAGVWYGGDSDVVNWKVLGYFPNAIFRKKGRVVERLFS